MPPLTYRRWNPGVVAARWRKVILGVPLAALLVLLVVEGRSYLRQNQSFAHVALWSGRDPALDPAPGSPAAAYPNYADIVVSDAVLENALTYDKLEKARKEHSVRMEGLGGRLKIEPRHLGPALLNQVSPLPPPPEIDKLMQASQAPLATIPPGMFQWVTHATCPARIPQLNVGKPPLLPPIPSHPSHGTRDNGWDGTDNQSPQLSGDHPVRRSVRPRTSGRTDGRTDKQR